jgi:glycine/D-amino acid oxidase-like deaminating enzyme
MTATDPREVSFWLADSGDDLTPRPPLDGTTEVDVAVLGAGYSGLWTALYLLRGDPSLRVVLLEREFAGFGASGRNGAWCAPDLNISIPELARRYGTAAARAIQEETYNAVEEVGRVSTEEGIDAGWHRGGQLTIARGTHQLPAMRERIETYERFGFGDRNQLLSAEGLAEHIRVAGALGAVYSPECAVVHPGRLVRGLARAVERRGGVIHEGTEVIDFSPGVQGGTLPALHTPRGDVRARAIVLAGEAYMSRLPRLHRQLLPLYSLIVLTEPVRDERWAEIGWAARECIQSYRLSVDYLSRTEDGRILFGGRGAPYRLGSPIRPEFDRHDATHEMLRGFVRSWFPVLADVRFTHAWGGPLGMARDWMPTIAHDPSTGIATARGYVGHGVAATNIAGRALADLILGRRTALTELPIVGHRSRDWEIEPLRWMGVRYAQQAFAGIDARSERTGRPPGGPSLARWLGRH